MIRLVIKDHKTQEILFEADAEGITDIQVLPAQRFIYLNAPTNEKHPEFTQSDIDNNDGAGT